MAPPRRSCTRKSTASTNTVKSAPAPLPAPPAPSRPFLAGLHVELKPTVLLDPPFIRLPPRATTPIPEIDPKNNLTFEEYRKKAIKEPTIEMKNTFSRNVTLRKILLVEIKRNEKMWQNYNKNEARDNYLHVGYQAYRRTGVKVALKSIMNLFKTMKDSLRSKLKTSILQMKHNPVETEKYLKKWDLYRYIHFFRDSMLKTENKMRGQVAGEVVTLSDDDSDEEDFEETVSLEMDGVEEQMDNGGNDTFDAQFEPNPDQLPLPEDANQQRLTPEMQAEAERRDQWIQQQQYENRQRISDQFNEYMAEQGIYEGIDYQFVEELGENMGDMGDQEGPSSSNGMIPNNYHLEDYQHPASPVSQDRIEMERVLSAAVEASSRMSDQRFRQLRKSLYDLVLTTDLNPDADIIAIYNELIKKELSIRAIVQTTETQTD